MHLVTRPITGKMIEGKNFAWRAALLRRRQERHAGMVKAAPSSEVRASQTAM
jgi:hypothetical protein